MNNEIHEQLSALADDELSAAERPLLLGRLQRDLSLRACLGRYHLIGEVMRGGDVEAATLGVADRVQKALAADDPIGVAPRHAEKHTLWWKPVAGLAVAASVALVAVLSVSSFRTDSEALQAPVLASAEPSNTSHAPVFASSEALAPIGPSGATIARVSDAPAEEQWARLDPRIDKRLSGYLVNHNEYAASRGVQGVMPYVRIVGYDTGE